MKKYLLLSIFLIVFIIGCSKSVDNGNSDDNKSDTQVLNNGANQDDDNNSGLNNLSIIKIKEYAVLDKDLEFSESDFNKVMMLLDREFERRLKEDKDDYQVNEIKKNEYYFQVLKVEGEENNSNKVWVVASCEKFPGWKNKPSLVFDGGPCFFNFKADMEKGEIYSLFINGEA